MKSLYLGLDLPDYLKDCDLVHYPVIKIIPSEASNPDIKKAFNDLQKYSHIIFTSKSAVRVFFEFLKFYHSQASDISKKAFIVVGTQTAHTLQSFGKFDCKIADEETAEGVVVSLEKILEPDDYLLWPHSKLSRDVISNYLTFKKIGFHECILYDTIPHQPFSPPALEQFQEIIFTSPSTVDAFKQIYGAIPANKILTAIGPITKNHLEQLIEKKRNSD